MTAPFEQEPSDPPLTPPIEPSGQASQSAAPSQPVPAPRYVVPSQGEPLWMFLGTHGLRAGWSILVFAALVFLFVNIFGTLIAASIRDGLHFKLLDGTAASTIVAELAWVLALAASLAIAARLERRRFADYYLGGPAGGAHFLSGLLCGFAALSSMVGVMALGGWIRFGPAPDLQSHFLRHAATWAVAFLLVALTEEGFFRCFLQFTLARSINFWWALAIIGAMCVWESMRPASHGAAGVYAMAAFGLFPCLILQLKKSPHNGFWTAAWAGSTAFGFIHTSNSGETWLGILAAGAIGFVFCVSVRLTGSAWWAIGCHAAWDWAETYFYGTADSGFAARGHLFTTGPAGSTLWSGGSDGPEGSILVLPVIVLLLMGLILLYRPKTQLSV